MKKICLIIFASLFFTNLSWARTRWYRINPETVTHNGYAIAWGVRDVPVDFEAVEQSDESINEFLERYDNMIVNYLVDIQREIILAEVPSTTFFGHLGNIVLGSPYTLTLYEIPDAAGLLENQNALILTQNWKWDNSFSDAFIVENTPMTTKLIRHIDLNDDFREELFRKLNGRQRTAMEKKTLNYSLKPLGGGLYQFHVDGDIPKCNTDCDTVLINANANFSVDETALKINLSDLKFENPKQF